MRDAWIFTLGLLACASENSLRPDVTPAADSGPIMQPDAGGAGVDVPPDLGMREAPAHAPECTIIVATSPAPIDCATTHGLMWCAGKGTNGCVPCPYDPVDGGLRRRLDCDLNAVNGCELQEGDQNCGACGNACPSGQHCVTVWAVAPGVFSPHCE